MPRVGGVAACLLALGLLALGLPASPALGAAGPEPGKPVLLTADQMSFDRDNQVVTAEGNVEISQGERVLKADRLTYNQATGVVIASGSVSLTEPTGEVLFADRVELEKELREGVVENIGVLFPDDSRFAANGAVRTGGNKTDMRKAVFSPCKLCPDQPERAPLWQLKADRVVHDQAAQRIEYSDASMEIFGVPVAYAPFFWHPDPTVKRKSGFLAPTFGNDSQLGFFTQVPYYINISPDTDATFAPIFTTKEPPVAAGELRHRFLDGQAEVSGSVARVGDRDDLGRELDNDTTRGHIFSKGRFEIDETWRWGFNGALTTDDTYLRRYDIKSPDRSDLLTSRIFVEGFRGRNYASAEAIHFQGLRAEDVQSRIPEVAPLINYNFISEPLANGSFWSIDGNLAALTRVDGTDSRRLSTIGGWQMPYIGRLGDLYTLSASVQGDIYWVNEVSSPSGGTTFRGITGRFFPQASLDWRYPLVRELGNVRQLLEPRLAFTIAPNGQNSGNIPNEDSLDFEFDDTNLFSPNRFAGRDRVSGGKHLTYGMRTAFYGDAGGETEIFLGQDYRLRTDDTFPTGSGLEDDFSDLVGRVRVRPSKYLDLLYRFRFDRTDFRAQRNEISMAAGPPSVRLNANYLFFGENAANVDFGEREEIEASLTVKLSDQWSVTGRERFDLTDGGGPLNYGGGVTFQNECILITADVSRNFFRDRDLQPSTRVFVRVVFKYLGEVGSAQ